MIDQFSLPVILNFLAILYLLMTTYLLFKNRYYVGGLLDKYDSTSMNTDIKVTICIPARNEESTIKQCVTSACWQNHNNFEVLVLDDESNDETPRLLSALCKHYPELLTVHSGSAKPQDWLGKNWACHQLFRKADGKIIIFIDADTLLEPDFIQKTVHTLEKEDLDFATVWPQQQMKTFWEKLLVPMVYHTLLTALPAKYVSEHPWWIPKKLHHKTTPLFAAACGQCMIFTRTAYLECGGHKRVKSEIVEDVAIAKNIKKAGLKMKMFHGLKSITCRMYLTENEIRNGFRKNFLAGFGYNIPLFLLVSFLHWIVFIFPYIYMIVALFLKNYTLLTFSIICCLLIYMQRFYVDKWFGWEKKYSLLHPFGVLWYQFLALLTLTDYFGDRSVKWKERAT